MDGQSRKRYFRQVWLSTVPFEGLKTLQTTCHGYSRPRSAKPGPKRATSKFCRGPVREGTPRLGVRQLARINGEFSIHEQIHYPGCQELWLFIGRLGSDGLGIKYDYVGKKAR